MEALFLRVNETCPECPECGNEDEVTWVGVGIAASLIAFNGLLSLVLGLGLFSRLLISAIRCMVQLTAMAFILTPVLGNENPAFVFGYSALLLVLASFDVTYHQGKKRYNGMFVTVLISMLLSSFLATYIGTEFSMNAEPFYEARLWIPTVGMLLGNSMSGFAIGLNSILNSLSVHGDHIEVYLAMGASRFEAARPVATDALRVGMLPTLNAMSVMGLISIPGMLTGQILAGADPFNAVRYQQIMMFLIASSTAMGTLLVVVISLLYLVDSKHRLRRDRIQTEEFFLYRWIGKLWSKIRRQLVKVKVACFGKKQKPKKGIFVEEEDDEEESLLGGSSSGDETPKDQKEDKEGA